MTIDEAVEEILLSWEDWDAEAGHEAQLHQDGGAHVDHMRRKLKGVIGTVAAGEKWHDWKGVTEPDWYWWWNGDPDSAPVPVAIGGSWNGSGYDRFAQTGQLGWTWAQPVEGMGGLWCRAFPPDLPRE